MLYNCNGQPGAKSFSFQKLTMSSSQVTALPSILRPSDEFIFLPVYYAGGTASFSPTSAEAAGKIREWKEKHSIVLPVSVNVSRVDLYEPQLIEMMQAVNEAWASLDEKYRRILEMKYILERSNEEIAKEFGVGSNSVRMLLTRARNKLKEKMTDENRYHCWSQTSVYKGGSSFKGIKKKE